MMKPRNIFARERVRRLETGMASICRDAWGLETALAAEKCALLKAKGATGSEK